MKPIEKADIRYESLTLGSVINSVLHNVLLSMTLEYIGDRTLSSEPLRKDTKGLHHVSM